MSARPEVIEAVRHWVRKAENDLEAVRRITSIEDHCPYDTVCFHCQQAIEKYLKALLTLVDVPAPRTHDPESLIMLLPAGLQLPVPASALIALNPYAVEVRYADDWREPSPSDAIRAVESPSKRERQSAIFCLQTCSFRPVPGM